MGMNELVILFSACDGDIEKFKEILKVIKEELSEQRRRLHA